MMYRLHFILFHFIYYEGSLAIYRRFNFFYIDFHKIYTNIYLLIHSLSLLGCFRLCVQVVFCLLDQLVQLTQL
jgi:hypothetical protein